MQTLDSPTSLVSAESGIAKHVSLRSRHHISRFAFLTLRLILRS